MELKKYKLGEIGRVVTGKTPSTSDKDNFNGEIPFITPSDITNNAYMLEKADRTISSKGFASIKANTITGWSILVGCIGSDMGNVGLVNMKCATNQQINSITNIKPFCNPIYLYYRLTTMKEEFRRKSNSTTTPILSKSDFENITLDIPSLAIQERIASVLSCIDKKIALNRAINQNLEALAKQLYDYWFVQFDFPNEEGKPYKSSGGKMVWNEKLKREIPEGWHCGNLFEIASFTNGLACQKFRPKAGEVPLPVIKIREMHDGISTDTEEVTPNIPESTKVYNGDVLFSWSASLEVMLWAYGPGGLNQHIFKVTSANDFPKSFYYFQLLDYVNVFKRMAESRKTTMGHITQDHLLQSTIAIPDNKYIADKFEEHVSSFFGQIVKLQEEISNLTKQRNELLPLLMNGQVTIE